MGPPSAVVLDTYRTETVIISHGRMNMRPLFLFGACITAMLITSSVRADEQIRIIAQSGEWGALVHLPSMTAAPDVCLAVNPTHGVAIRADGEDIEFRLTNKSWSLPAGVTGSIGLSVGSWEASLEINNNNSNTVTAVLPPDDVGPMFAAMDKSPLMSVTVGKAKPLNVSLVESAVAINAFRTCAGIHGNAKAPGSNPFE